MLATSRHSVAGWLEMRFAWLGATLYSWSCRAYGWSAAAGRWGALAHGPGDGGEGD